MRSDEPANPDVGRLTRSMLVPRSQPVMRRARIAMAFVATLPFALTSCNRSDEASASPRPREATAPVHVQTVPVSERLMPEYLALTGTLRADQESNIAADANGKVLQLLVERGQHVVHGQVIATLDARSASLSATAAQAQ